MSRPQPPSVSSVHHPRDLPLPLDARDHVINALLMNSTIQTLEKRLLETGEATGWLDALRKHALELVRSRRDVTCKEVVDQLTKEAWKGSRKMVHDLGENGTRADGFRVNVNVERMNGNGERVYDRQFFDNFDRYEQWVRQSHSTANQDSINPANLTAHPNSESTGMVVQPGPAPVTAPLSSNSSGGVRIPQALLETGVEIVKKALDELLEAPDNDPWIKPIVRDSQNNSVNEE